MMLLNTCAHLKRWQLIWRLALKKQMVTQPFSPRLWVILPALRACHKSRAMLAYRAKAFTKLCQEKGFLASILF